MGGSFRFMPPGPRPDALSRPRLLRALLGRWEHRVTSVVGGAGLGKTTLLAQAAAENRLTPRGDDVWIGVEPYDVDGDALALAVATALGSDGEPVASGAAEPQGVHGVQGVQSVQSVQGVEMRQIAEIVWQRSPSQVCLVFDDVHLLPRGSAGGAWLSALVDALPANGHVLLASRTEPPVPLARLEVMGAVLRLGEEDLRLSPEEIEAFAAGHGVDPERLEGSGGWPAMAELAASTARRRTDAYLWEEILEPLGPERRHLLAVVSDLGGADDRLASAAAGTRIDLESSLAGVPLVAAGADGWYVPHSLWRTASGLDLDPTERAEMRRRAAHDLLERDRIDQAFTLVKEAELWDVAPAVLRAACLESERLNPSQLERCLSGSPTRVRDSPAGSLATAMRLAFTQPADAVKPLRAAADACRAAGDVEGELTAIAQLGRLAWGRQDRAAIDGEVLDRIASVESTGHPTARSLAAFIRALIADLAGDDHAVLAELDAIEPGVLDPVWTAMATWFRGGVRIDWGEAEAVPDMLDEVEVTGDPAIAAILGGLRARTWWARGRIDQAVTDIPQLLDALRAAGVASIHAQGLVNAALALSFTGDAAAARECLAEAATTSEEPPDQPSVRTALATASLQVAEGDEKRAVETVRQALDLHGGPGQGPHRRVWRHVLSLSYVLVPETRATWDTAALRGHLAVARTMASALVAAREGYGDERLWRLDVSDLGRVRAALHCRHAAELAVALTAIGRTEGARLLDALGPQGRAAVNELSAARPKQAKPAKVLLASVPAPPPFVTKVAVLGPLTIGRDTGHDGRGQDATDPDLRRPRVRALLAYLATHRKTHRAAITATLWPDHDAHAAGNNLGVTLNHLLRSLEPWRRAGEPPYLVRLDGQSVELMTGPYLHVDVDDFNQHLAAAARAEAEGNASAALEHDLAASALYRDDLFVDVPEAEWLDIDRAHYRSRFVTISTRAAQLLVGRGDSEQAERLAQRVLTADPWNEDAYGVIATAALARGDRSAARDTLGRCVAALADLGAEPSDTTQQLARRCGFPTPAAPQRASR